MRLLSLQVYEKALGQCINFQKSSISFSANTSEGCREDIFNILEVNGTWNHGL